MSNFMAVAASSKVMKQGNAERVLASRGGPSGPRSSRRSEPLDGPGPWIVFAVGVLLLLAAALARGDEGATVHRTERFTATLPAHSRLRVVNVSGDVVASPGREFSAVCNTTVTATSKARAEELLAHTRTWQARDGDELRRRRPRRAQGTAGHRA